MLALLWLSFADDQLLGSSLDTRGCLDPVAFTSFAFYMYSFFGRQEVKVQSMR